MYTNLRAKLIIKEEYREMIQGISKGDSWSEYAERYPFLKNFAALGRANLIPIGMSFYVPAKWAYISQMQLSIKGGFNNHFDTETGLWTFLCSLKNYEGEIEEFIKNVLPNIIEKCIYIEEWYEEADESTIYHLIDGQLVKDEMKSNQIDQTINVRKSCRT